MSDDADRPVFTVMTSSTDKAKAYAAAWKDAAKAYRGRNADLYAENTELTRAYFACAKERDEALAAYETFRASIAKAEDGLIRERDFAHALATDAIDRVWRLEGAIREALDYLGAYDLEASVGILRAALAANAPVLTHCQACGKYRGLDHACVKDGSDV